MSTHATIGYELPGGGYAGCYCHYDGYPDSVIPGMLALGHDGVMMAVEKALLEGGFRCFHSDEVETFFERHGAVESSPRSQFLQDTWPCHEEEFNYIIRLDGNIECYARGEMIDVSGLIKKFQESA